MPAPRSVYLCMGSACHQRGVYDLLPRLRELLEQHQCHVELKGSFCLGPCMEGIVLQIGDDQIIRINANSLETIFAEQILLRVREEKP
ncbi:MAG: NAD(P)H-dependent oxidoreductase subunit E [Tepidisphaeraceae bacterium]